MSVHSCSNGLCEIDGRLHVIIKHAGPHPAWHPTPREMEHYLFDLLMIVRRATGDYKPNNEDGCE